MRDILVSTKNCRALCAGIERVITRPAGAGRLMLVQGAPGTGKTSVAKQLAKQYGGIYYSVPELVTARSYLSELLRALHGWQVELRSTQALFERLLADLETKGWPPLFLDESDRLAKARGRYDLLDLTRDIHDRGRSPLVFFSVQQLARLLTRGNGGYEEVYTSRLGATLHFERPSLEDAALLARELIEGVTLDQELIQHCLDHARDSFRPLMGMFSDIEHAARAASLASIDLQNWKALTGQGKRPAVVKAIRAVGGGNCYAF